MTLTRREFGRIAAAGAVLPAVVLEGCTAAQWFDLVESLIPITLNTVTGLGAILGLPTGDIALLTAFAGSATTLLNDVKADVTAFQTSSDPTLIGKIESLLNELKTQASGIAGGLQVKNPTLLGKIGAFTNAIIADAIDLLGLLPTVTTTAPSSPTAAVTARVVLPKSASLPKLSALKQQFEARLATAQSK